MYVHLPPLANASKLHNPYTLCLICTVYVYIYYTYGSTVNFATVHIDVHVHVCVQKIGAVTTIYMYNVCGTGNLR